MKMQRVAALDTFRGAVILTMVFVNYLPGMPGVPGLFLHAEADVDGYTLADVVFPGFLFILGVAIPLAVEKRLASGEDRWSILSHVCRRSLALLFLGVITVNHGVYSDNAFISREVWYLLAYASVLILLFRESSELSAVWRGRWKTLRLLALLMLGILLVLFRADDGSGNLIWLRPYWWGILGIIGWAYLSCSAYYLLLRENRVALLGLLAFLIAFYMGDRQGALPVLDSVRPYLNFGELFGTHPAISLSGVLVGTLFAGSAHVTDIRTRVRFLFFLGAGLYLAGMLLRPVHGIHKIGGTESFALVTSGLSCIAFLVVYVLMDGLGVQSWASFLAPVGRNPILAYLLPDILGSLMALTGTWSWFWPMWSEGGLPGLINALLMTGLVLLVTWGLTRIGFLVRL